MKNKEFLQSIKQCCVEILISIKILSDPPGEDDDEIFESTTQAIQKSAESMKFMSDLIAEALEDVDDEIEVKENLLEASNLTRGSIIAYIKLSKSIIANPFMANQDTTVQDKANYSYNVASGLKNVMKLSRQLCQEYFKKLCMEYSLKINEFMKSVNVQFEKKDVAGFKSSIAEFFEVLNIWQSCFLRYADSEEDTTLVYAECRKLIQLTLTFFATDQPQIKEQFLATKDNILSGMRSVITRMNAETEEYNTINADANFPSLPSSPRTSSTNANRSPNASTTNSAKSLPPKLASKPASLSGSAAEHAVPTAHSPGQRHVSVDSEESPRVHNNSNSAHTHHSPPSNPGQHLGASTGSNRSTGDSDGSDSARDSISPRSFPTPQYAAPMSPTIMSPRPQASGEGMTGTYKPIPQIPQSKTLPNTKSPPQVPPKDMSGTYSASPAPSGTSSNPANRDAPNPLRGSAESLALLDKFIEIIRTNDALRATWDQISQSERLELSKQIINEINIYEDGAGKRTSGELSKAQSVSEKSWDRAGLDRRTSNLGNRLNKPGPLQGKQPQPEGSNEPPKVPLKENPKGALYGSRDGEQARPPTQSLSVNALPSTPRLNLVSSDGQGLVSSPSASHIPPSSPRSRPDDANKLAGRQTLESSQGGLVAPTQSHGGKDFRLFDTGAFGTLKYRKPPPLHGSNASLTGSSAAMGDSPGDTAGALIRSPSKTAIVNQLDSFFTSKQKGKARVQNFSFHDKSLSALGKAAESFLNESVKFIIFSPEFLTHFDMKVLTKEEKDKRKTNSRVKDEFYKFWGNIVSSISELLQLLPSPEYDSGGGVLKMTLARIYEQLKETQQKGSMMEFDQNLLMRGVYPCLIQYNLLASLFRQWSQTLYYLTSQTSTVLVDIFMEAKESRENLMSNLLHLLVLISSLLSQLLAMSSAVETLFYIDSVLNLVDQQATTNTRQAGRARARLVSTVHKEREVQAAPNKEVILESFEESTDPNVLLQNATVSTLVQRLCPKSVVPCEEFSGVFLTTWSVFTDAEQLVDVLVEIWKSLSRSKECPVPPLVLQQRILQVIDIWIYDNPEHLNEALKQKITAEFIGKVLASEESKRLHKLAKCIETELARQDAFLFVEAKWKPHLSIPCYSGFAPCQTPMLIDEKTLADQLTIIEMEIYKKIMPPELLNQNWSFPKTQLLALNVSALILRANAVSFWVATTILLQPRLKQRIQVFTNFVNIAVCLREQNNFNTLMGIIAGLNTSSVSRLKHTKAGVKSRSMEQFDALQEIMNPSKSFQRLRSEFEGINNKSVLPYIGMHLADLTFIDVGNKDYIPNDQGKPSDVVNFQKMHMVYTAIRKFLQYQKVPMFGYKVESIISLLYELPRLSEDELFNLSVLREPKGSSVKDILQ